MKIKIADIAIGVLILFALAMTILAFTQVRPSHPLPWGGVQYDGPPSLPQPSIPSVLMSLMAKRVRET